MEPVKNIGSMYINVPKDTDSEVEERVKKGVEFFKKNKVRFSVSLRNDEGGYTKLTGFFNDFKKSDKDPDVVLRPTMAAGTAPKTKPTKKVEADDDIPF